MLLSKQDSQQIVKILTQFFPEKLPAILVFGSRVDGTAKEYSDLDLIVQAEPVLPLSVYYQLKDAFEYLTLNFRVDLLDWFRLSDEFKQTIANKTVNLVQEIEAGNVLL